MATRVEAMSETDPRIFAARRRRVAIGLSSSEHSKIKLDPRVAKFAVGATLVAAGVISLALPTIDSAASVDVLAYPPYSPAPAEQVKPTAGEYFCSITIWRGVSDCSGPSNNTNIDHHYASDLTRGCTSFTTGSPQWGGVITDSNKWDCSPASTSTHSVTPTKQPKP